MRLTWAPVVGTVAVCGLLASGFIACSGFSAADDSSGDAGDGSAPSEAGPDATDATDGSSADAQEASVRFCKVAPHAFCDDFDDGPLGNGWSRRTGSDAGLTLDTTTFSSPPRSMQVDVDPLASSMTFGTALEYDVPGTTPPQGLTVAFALRVTALGNPNTIHPVRVRFDGSQTALAFTLFGTQVEIADEDTDGGATSSEPTGLNLVVGAWNTIELSIPKDAQPTLKVNDLSAQVSLTARIALPMHLEVGAPFAAGPSSQWTLEIDNVTLDIVP